MFVTKLPATSSVSAQTPLPLNQRVLVVYNANNPDSLDVANYYVSRRNIPSANKCAITPSNVEYVEWGEYNTGIKDRIKQCLNTVGRENILYIVFSYNTPYKTQDPANPPPTYDPITEEWIGRGGTAIDSLIADIWNTDQSGLWTPNFYLPFTATRNYLYTPFISLADYRNSPGAATIYSTWRLDGANPALARGLVDKAISAENNGLFGRGCFDGETVLLHDVTPDTSYNLPRWDIYRAAEFAREKSFEVLEDLNPVEFGTAPAPLRCDNAALYAGRYSLNNYNDAFTWSTGAIGFHLDSLSAPNPRGGTNWSANAIIRGITVTSGSVAEPFVAGLVETDGFFRNLFEGANVGDAALRNTRWLKWQIINLGDPLYRPFPGSTFPVAPSPMESPWTSIDIGNVGLQGRSNIYNEERFIFYPPLYLDRGNIAVEGAGANFWYNQDAFHYLYQTLYGDGEIRIRVERVEGITGDSKAGLMIREQLTPNSRHITLSMTPREGITPPRGIEIVRREETDGGSLWFPGGTEKPPYWLRIVRSGNNFTCYKSSDGQNWTQLREAFTISMNTNVYIGLIAYSNNTARLSKSFFSQLRLTP